MTKSELRDEVLDYLDAEKVYAFPVRGKTGQADILAFPKIEHCFDKEEIEVESIVPTWIELKVNETPQSDEERGFQHRMEREGHRYIMARSLNDVRRVI